MLIKSENRKRSKNFDNLKREVLLECAIENRDIIESKFTNQVTNIKNQSLARHSNQSQCPRGCEPVSPRSTQQME